MISPKELVEKYEVKYEYARKITAWLLVEHVQREWDERIIGDLIHELQWLGLQLTHEQD